MENEITVQANTYTNTQIDMIISYQNTTSEISEKTGVPAEVIYARPDIVILSRELEQDQGK